MNVVDAETRIRGIVSEVSNQEVTLVSDESLFDSGILDSFALVDLVAALEREFGVKIPDSDLNPRKFSSIARIQSYLESIGSK